MEDKKRTPLSASVMEELGFVPCEPRKRRSEERIPDMTIPPKQAHGFSRGSNWARKKIAQLNRFSYICSVK
jgi:hypothetical protein